MYLFPTNASVYRLAQTYVYFTANVLLSVTTPVARKRPFHWILMKSTPEKPQNFTTHHCFFIVATIFYACILRISVF